MLANLQVNHTQIKHKRVNMTFPITVLILFLVYLILANSNLKMHKFQRNIEWDFFTAVNAQEPFVLLSHKESECYQHDLEKLKPYTDSDSALQITKVLLLTARTSRIDPHIADVSTVIVRNSNCYKLELQDGSTWIMEVRHSVLKAIRDGNTQELLCPFYIE